MSIPAETPAAVTISPLSTNRSSGRTSIVGSELGEPVEAPPPGRRRAVAQEACGGEHERAGADARHQRAVLPKPAQAVEHLLVGELAARPEAAGVDEDVDRGRGLPRVVGQDAHALRARHRSAVVATVKTSTPSSGHCVAHAASTSHGPAKSSSSAPSKSATAIVSRCSQLAPRPRRGRLQGSAPAAGGGSERRESARRIPAREQDQEARASATASSRSRIASVSPPRSSRRGSSASVSSPKTRSKSGVTR